MILIVAGWPLISLMLWALAKIQSPGAGVDFWPAIVQSAALAGVTLLNLNFVFSSRHPKLDEWYGFDQVYGWHRRTGTLAYTLIIMHLTALSIQSWPHWWGQLREHLVPGTYLPYNWGIFAFWLLTGLICLTLLVKLPYETWKSTHKLMGLVLPLSALHYLTVPSDAGSFLPLTLWLGVTTLIGITTYIYRQFLHPRIAPRGLAQITRIAHLNRVVQIHLKPKTLFTYHPGQYAFVSFHSDNVKPESHPFSFSSSPHARSLRLSIKQLGDFTRSLDFLRQGDSVNLEGPYGHFGRRALATPHPMVWIAGGIGITPFLSLLGYIQVYQKDRQLHIYYTTRSLSDALYLKEIQSKLQTMPRARLFHHRSGRSGRLTAELIMQQSRPVPDTYYLICGPLPMMRQLSTQLKAKGVPAARISFENFSLR